MSNEKNHLYQVIRISVILSNSPHLFISHLQLNKLFLSAVLQLSMDNFKKDFHCSIFRRTKWVWKYDEYYSCHVMNNHVSNTVDI